MYCSIFYALCFYASMLFTEYVLYDKERTTFSGSIEKCQSVGMVLIRPASKLESQKINEVLSSTGIQGGAWFSKTTYGPSGHKYADGSTVLYNGWQLGQPNEGGLTACGYVSSNSGLWYDYSSCDEATGYTICQKGLGNRIIRK